MDMRRYRAVACDSSAVVMCQGRVTGEFARPNLSQEEIMTCATRFLRLDAVDETGAVIAPTESGDREVAMAVHQANE